MISYGDFYTTGEMGHKGGVIGDMVIYAHGNFLAEGGGRANVSIYVNGSATINTIGDSQGADHSVLNLLTVEWTAEDEPLGLPPGYPAATDTYFNVDNQSTHPPVWQRT